MQLGCDSKEGPVGTLSSPGRRRLLAGALVAATAAPAFFKSAAADSRPHIVGRWPTGNPTLYPFTLAHGNLYLNGNATIEAIDLNREERLWARRLESPAVFRPRIAQHQVISAGRAELTAWDKQRGSKTWSYSGANELGVPLVHHDRVHFGEGHRLLALDVGTGRHLWSFATDARARVAYAPTGDGDTIYLGAGDGVLYALADSSGELLWKVDREKDWQYLRQLAVSGDVLVAGGYHDELFGMDKADGRIRWRFNAGNFINSQLVTRKATYFWSPTGWIYALNTDTGAVLWRHKTIDYRNKARRRNWAPIMAEMAVREDRLYVLSMDHVLHILSRETGEEMGQFPMPEPMRPFFALENGTNRLLTGSENGEVFLLELQA